ncbi:MAG: AtpZ/AtpI family protein [Chloroflexi bacterium]|nr:AtpZ/AtpI family protein [Chloroflexota bacterium]MBI5829237.1 AtpZ/AtpI family protein [Chloroflexota bacterium]
MTPKPNNNQYALNLGLAGFAGQVGCITLLIVFGALFGGLWLDGFLRTKPLFTIVLLIGSVPVTIFVMFRVALSAVAKIKPVQPASARPVKEENPSE